jgi:hypothetical protein
MLVDFRPGKRTAPRLFDEARRNREGQHRLTVLSCSSMLPRIILFIQDRGQPPGHDPDLERLARQLDRAEDFGLVCKKLPQPILDEGFKPTRQRRKVGSEIPRISDASIWLSSRRQLRP